MIVTILPSSSDFHAVEYNEKKVASGSATLLEIKNFGSIDDFGYDDPQELINHLKRYSSENPRVSKPQFHLAFSCKGDEMTHQELLDFAHQYLKEMGYGEEGQPLLVYAHSDTDNNHIHVITSRVDPNGNKINDSNERRRSQKVIEKLLGKDEKLQLDKHLKDIKDFNYRSVTQYRSILEALGYECYEKNNQLNIKKGGIVLKSINISDIEKRAKQNEQLFEEPNYKKLFGIFSKYRDLNSDMDGVKKDLRKNFGLELVFFGRKDSPYGYAVVDFKNKCVYEGSKIMGIKRLNKFLSAEERKNKIDQFIYDSLKENPRLTTKDLNKKLRKLNAYIKKDEIISGGVKDSLDKNLKEMLDLNNKLEWIDSFHPQNEDEYRLLLKFSGINEEKVQIPDSFKPHSYNPQMIKNIQNIFKSNNIEQIKSDLENAGYRLITFNGKNYIYSNKDKALIDLDKIDIKLPQDKKQNLSTPVNKNTKINELIKLNNNTPTHGTNREWEVGSKDRWDEVDNGNQLKY